MELSRITGMWSEQEFMVKPGRDDWAKDPLFNHVFKSYRINGTEHLKMRPRDSTDWIRVDVDLVYRIITHSPESIIPIKLYLTKEQRDQFESCLNIGLCWLAKDKDGIITAFSHKPEKDSHDMWSCDCTYARSLRMTKGYPVYSLIGWNDSKPLDIALALQEAEG